MCEAGKPRSPELPRLENGYLNAPLAEACSDLKASRARCGSDPQKSHFPFP
jgi:hypothetical protein